MKERTADFTPLGSTGDLSLVDGVYMITRAVGRMLRGRATGVQVGLAAFLGVVLGFVPGFLLPGDLSGGLLQAPALIVVVLALVLVLNTNLMVFGGALALAKVAALVLAPASFALGRALLDGPMTSVMRAAASTPILAWCGLERYATVGGLVLGVLFGMGAAVGAARLLRVERASRAYLPAETTSPGVVLQRCARRVVTWVFYGVWMPHPQCTARVALARDGRPIRVTGVVTVASAFVGLWLGHGALVDDQATRATREALTQWTGVTVDASRTEIDLTRGRITLHGFAAADPSQLDRDILSCDELTFELDPRELARRRFVVDRVTSRGARTGSLRETPGVFVGEAAARHPTALPSPSLARYLAEPERWQRRIDRLTDWFDHLAGGGGGPMSGVGGSADVDWGAARRCAAIVASDVAPDVPDVLIREVVLDGVAAERWNGGLVDIVARNLSSHPELVPPLELEIRARNGAFEWWCRRDGVTGVVSVRLVTRGLRADDLAARLRTENVLPFRGGTVELAFEGEIHPGQGPGDEPWVDLPLRVILRGTTIALPGSSQVHLVDRMELNIGIHGPLDALEVTLDQEAAADALVAAGQAELSAELTRRARKWAGVNAGWVLQSLRAPTDGTAESSEGESAESGLLDRIEGLLPTRFQR